VVNLSAKKPTNLKLLEGNPGKRPINKGEVNPEIAIPKCPEWLMEEAKKEWERISIHLYHLKLLTQIDMAGLASYCQYYAKYLEAEKKLLIEGEMLTSKKGNDYINPRTYLSNTYNREMRNYLSKFGLTPSDRANLDMIMDNELTEDEKEMLELLK
jgi:P27 family predicted phage terminase small subunit